MVFWFCSQDIVLYWSFWNVTREKREVKKRLVRETKGKRHHEAETFCNVISMEDEKFRLFYFSA